MTAPEMCEICKRYPYGFGRGACDCQRHVDKEPAPARIGPDSPAIACEECGGLTEHQPTCSLVLAVPFTFDSNRVTATPGPFRDSQREPELPEDIERVLFNIIAAVAHSVRVEEREMGLAVERNADALMMTAKAEFRRVINAHLLTAEEAASMFLNVEKTTPYQREVIASAIAKLRARSSGSPQE